MTNSSKQKGSARELKVRDVLVEAGYLVMKAGGSLGAADLIALKRGERPRMVQVKANKDGGPWNKFGRAARAELAELAEAAGAVAELAWWPPHGDLKWYDQAVWP